MLPRVAGHATGAGKGHAHDEVLHVYTPRFAPVQHFSLPFSRAQSLSYPHSRPLAPIQLHALLHAKTCALTIAW
jgi:hypothetical protein